MGSYKALDEEEEEELAEGDSLTKRFVMGSYKALDEEEEEDSELLPFIT